jgi:hypothetical protein
MPSSTPQVGVEQSIGLVKDHAKSDLAGHLPFDILSQVFEEYVLQETPRYPVEMLLLVCTSWLQAALDLPRLWTTFTMDLNDLIFWEHRILRRLRLCPSESLLDIEIGSRGPCYTPKQTTQSVFRILSGSNGDNALRWRTFKVNDRHGHLYNEAGESIIGSFCGYPTPNLRELDLQNFVCLSPIFPVTPSLKVFSSYNVSLPHFPDLTPAIAVDISIDTGTNNALLKAVNTLKLGVKPSWTMPSCRGVYQLVVPYGRLTALHLSQGLREGGLVQFSAPALQTLSLNFTRGNEFLEVASCKGIPFHQVKTIVIEYKPEFRGVVDLGAYRGGLRHLLCVANSVESLHLKDEMPQTQVLQLLATDLGLLSQDSDVFISVGGYNMKLGQGKDRPTSITIIRACARGIYDDT